jgi:hypothetical protein
MEIMDWIFGLLWYAGQFLIGFALFVVWLLGIMFALHAGDSLGKRMGRTHNANDPSIEPSGATFWLGVPLILLWCNVTWLLWKWLFG